MNSTVIRPSTKTVKAAFVFVLLLVAGFAVFWLQRFSDQPPWVAALPVVLFWFPLRMQLRRAFTKLTLDGTKLKYEEGFLNKTTRNLDLQKVQDVRVDQSLGQRMLGTGNLCIETAGETSRLIMTAIDRPHQVAESILEIARGGGLAKATAHE